MILTAEELKAIIPIIGAPMGARAYRNHLLTLSDSQVWPDHVPDEWRTYRQALRDLPAQAGFPATAAWPTKPE
tara:strand:+ start:25764 stop:25982 length:219 start_codon:yes stop_codon:yes gene_type:complete